MQHRFGSVGWFGWLVRFDPRLKSWGNELGFIMAHYGSSGVNEGYC
jgi:hypothetical protein